MARKFVVDFLAIDQRKGLQGLDKSLSSSMHLEQSHVRHGVDEDQ